MDMTPLHLHLSTWHGPSLLELCLFTTCMQFSVQLLQSHKQFFNFEVILNSITAACAFGMASTSTLQHVICISAVSSTCMCITLVSPLLMPLEYDLLILLTAQR